MTKLRILTLLLLFLSFLLHSSLALTISVSGGYKGEVVTVNLDKEAFIIFRMNNGTPVFAYGKTAKFIPHVTGKLYVEAKSGNEIASATVTIRERPTSRTEETTGTYALPSGKAKITLEDGSVEEVEYRTALGALIRAAEVKCFTVKVKKWSYGLFVDCIKGLCTKALGAASGWMYAVNGKIPSVSSEEYTLNPGDKVVWYFSRSMSETPESSPYKVEIVTFPDWTFNVHVYWKPTTSESTETYSGEEKETAKATPTPTPRKKIVEFNLTEKVEVLKPGEVAKVKLKVPLELKVESERPVLVKISQRKIGGLEFRNVHADVIEAFELDVNGSAKITVNFSLEKEALKSDPNNVCLARYTNDSWTCLPTKIYGENETHYFFTSTISNFSLFAVIVKWSNFPLNSNDEAIVKALNWLRTAQNEDGGFANPGENSSVAKTSWAVMAIVAAGEDPKEWKKNGKSPIDYLRENIKKELPKMGTADYARTILALVAAGENPRNFAGVNLVEKLKEKMKDNGQIGDFVYTTIWGIIALVSVGENVSKSVEWLKAQQNEDGGFAWTVGEKSDFDDTAAAIQALIAAGEPRDSEVIKRALEYLKKGQNEDGGMRYFGNSASNAASDSWTIQALVAAGINPREWKKNNISVVDHLLSLQTEDGYFKYTKYQTSNPGYMTVSAIMALLGKAHPIKVMKITEMHEVVTPTPETTPTIKETPKLLKTPTQKVTPTIVQTPEKVSKTTTPEKKEIPGFGAAIAILTLLVARAVRK